MDCLKLSVDGAWKEGAMAIVMLTKEGVMAIVIQFPFH